MVVLIVRCMSWCGRFRVLMCLVWRWLRGVRGFLLVGCMSWLVRLLGVWLLGVLVLR